MLTAISGLCSCSGFPSHPIPRDSIPIPAYPGIGWDGGIARPSQFFRNPARVVLLSLATTSSFDISRFFIFFSITVSTRGEFQRWPFSAEKCLDKQMNPNVTDCKFIRWIYAQLNKDLLAIKINLSRE